MTKDNSLRYVYFGSSGFSRIILEGLCRKGFTPALAVTRPDRHRGRGMHLSGTQISVFCQSAGIDCFKPDSLRGGQAPEKIKSLDPEFIIVADYGMILPGELIKSPSRCCLGVHPSLLPAYRGPTPIESAIINGEGKTGVTIFAMDEGVDSGGIIIKRPAKIVEEDNYFTVRDRLALMGVDMLIEVFPGLLRGEISPMKQDSPEATFTRCLKKIDGAINWSEQALLVSNTIKALAHWPVAYTYYKGRKIKILDSAVTDTECLAQPGTVIGISREGIDVAALAGAVRIKRLRPQDKKEMDSYSFACGYRVKRGDRFL